MMFSFAFLAGMLAMAHAYPVITLGGRASSALSSLETCLSNSGGTPLSYAQSPDYATLASSYNPIFTFQPLVIALPSTASQVSDIVKCVSAEKGQYKLSPKSGGHSYQAYSFGGQNGSVVIDLRHFDYVKVDRKAKTARVGAGVRLGLLASEIWKEGGFALPHGTCPMVGVSGHALGGGFGYPTRAWGFLMDRIVEMRMIDRNSTEQTVNRDENKDLWWAMRGGGSNNFGIITEFTFALVDAPKVTLNYAYSYKSNDDCAKALVALQSMTLDRSNAGGLEANFGGELLVVGEAGAEDGNACSLSGQHIDATQEEHEALMQRFHDLAGITPRSKTVTPFAKWIDSLTDIMGDLNVTGKAANDHEQFYAKSLVQPAESVYDFISALALVKKLNGYAGIEGTGNSVSFDFLGPQSYPASKAQDAAFNAHHATFISQFYSWGFPGNDNPQGQQKVWDAFDEMVSTAMSAKPDAEWGAYVNYVDARLHGWAQMYYGSALQRLKQLKVQWDPENIFWFPQGLSEA